MILLKTRQIAGKTKFNHQVRKNLRVAREDIKAQTIKKKLTKRNNMNQLMKRMIKLKSKKFKFKLQRKLNSRARMIYHLFLIINAERKLQENQMKTTKIKILRIPNLRKMHRARHTIVVEDEVEERHIKKRKTQIQKVKVDPEEGNQSNLFRSNKLSNSKYMSPNRMMLKLKTHTKMIHNSSLQANLKISIQIPMKCMMKKSIQTKDKKFI